MENKSKCLKNGAQERRSVNKSVVHKANLSSTFTKKSLRANNRALAKALTKKKQEFSVLFSNYVKLQGETNLLRLHVNGCDLEMSRFYAEKFLQFRNTVGDAVKLLHGVCGQLIDISANFESTSEFFQNMQSISISKPNTYQSIQVARSSKPAQRVILTSDYVASDGEEADDANKSLRDERFLGVIEEEDSQLSVADDDVSKIDEEKEPNDESCSIQSSLSLDKCEVDMITEVEVDISDATKATQSQNIATFSLDEDKPIEEHSLKDKISSSRKKVYISKPGLMKYSSVKPALDNVEKLKFKSLSASQTFKLPTEADDNLEKLPPECVKSNPEKEKQMSVYDISLDDSSYVAPPIPQAPKGQIPLKDILFNVENKITDDLRGEEVASDSHGIMLRLGNGSRTKPKGKCKSVRYSEDVNAVSLRKASVDSDICKHDLATEPARTAAESIETSDKQENASENVINSQQIVEDKFVKATEETVLKSTENIIEEQAIVEEDMSPVKSQNIKHENIVRDSMDSRCSGSSEGTSRKRRAASSVNYREPPLNSKLRKGDPHTSTIYEGDKNAIKKRGKKSTT